MLILDTLTTTRISYYKENEVCEINKIGSIVENYNNKHKKAVLMNICTEDISGRGEYNLNYKIHNSKKQSSKTWMVGSLYKHNNRHLMSNNIQLSCKECNP